MNGVIAYLLGIIVPVYFLIRSNQRGEKGSVIFMMILIIFYALGLIYSL